MVLQCFNKTEIPLFLSLVINYYMLLSIIFMTLLTSTLSQSNTTNCDDSDEAVYKNLFIITMCILVALVLTWLYERSCDDGCWWNRGRPNHLNNGLN